jgi:hypothetical protein
MKDFDQPNSIFKSVFSYLMRSPCWSQKNGVIGARDVLDRRTEQLAALANVVVCVKFARTADQNDRKVMPRKALTSVRLVGNLNAETLNIVRKDPVAGRLKRACGDSVTTIVRG